MMDNTRKTELPGKWQKLPLSFKTLSHLSGFHSQESPRDLASWPLGQNLIVTTNKNKLFLLSYP